MRQGNNCGSGEVPHGQGNHNSQAILLSEMVPFDIVSCLECNDGMNKRTRLDFRQYISSHRIAVCTALMGFTQSMLVASMYRVRTLLVMDIVVSVA